MRFSTVICLTLPELLYVARRAVSEGVQVRDHGLLESALARPRTSVCGEAAYSSLEEKAAALMQSVAKNHGLVDGNKRLTLASTIAFLGMNGYRLNLTNDHAYERVMAVATGELDRVGNISERLKPAISRRPG